MYLSYESNFHLTVITGTPGILNHEGCKERPPTPTKDPYFSFYSVFGHFCRTIGPPTDGCPLLWAILDLPLHIAIIDGMKQPTSWQQVYQMKWRYHFTARQRSCKNVTFTQHVCIQGGWRGGGRQGVVNIKCIVG